MHRGTVRPEHYFFAQKVWTFVFCGNAKRHCYIASQVISLLCQARNKCRVYHTHRKHKKEFPNIDKTCRLCKNPKSLETSWHWPRNVKERRMPPDFTSTNYTRSQKLDLGQLKGLHHFPYDLQAGDDQGGGRGKWWKPGLKQITTTETSYECQLATTNPRGPQTRLRPGTGSWRETEK